MATTDKSFLLRASKIHDGGVGVFAIHYIPKDTWLAVKPRGTSVGVNVQESEIPKELIGYCIANENGTWRCPPDFSCMHLVWHLNHSNTPNAEKRDDGYYALSDIKAGDEIVINYNSLGEPENKKADFYK